jgi:hypothetical protein
MTLMVHYVAVLPDGRNLSDLGEDWRADVQELRETHLPYSGPPDWLQKPHVRTDWGTVIYEVDGDELLRLCGHHGEAGKRYIAVWMECY